MKLSVSRLEGFSDGLIAIIMTLMVLEIQVPQSVSGPELLDFMQSLLIYGASFIIVGSQWSRHHRILYKVETVSNTFIWMNLIVLFLISLIPLFMKWLIRFPSSVAPALGYAVVYLLNDFGMRVLFITLMKENSQWNTSWEAERRRERLSLIHVLLLCLYLAVFIALSVLLPELSIICFVILPVIMSLRNLFGYGERKGRGRTGKPESDRRPFAWP